MPQLEAAEATVAQVVIEVEIAAAADVPEAEAVEEAAEEAVQDEEAMAAVVVAAAVPVTKGN